jgi:hypothetical protein
MPGGRGVGEDGGSFGTGEGARRALIAGSDVP